MTTWKYTDATKRVVSRTFDNGSMESCMVEAIAEWLSEGNTPEPYIEPVPTYQELRQRAYPSIPDQLDTIFHGGIDAWKATIATVKNKYPKSAEEAD
jgi:hypothetical protein